ncbi:MAG: MFS transporter [Planctomycetes bacterium]|nr:MFS transporter [Planctomycetota bacterium]
MQELSLRQRITVLAAAFLGWMFGGLQIALFVLIHRPAMLSLLGVSPATMTPEAAALNEQTITHWFAWYQAAFLLGAASGGWIFGMLGDRFGRTKSLAASILCYSVLTGACYFARSPWELLVLRFLACHGIGGAWPNTVALVAEAWPAASRPLLAGVLGTAANVGQVAMGLLGLGFDVTVDSWRWTFLAGAAPAAIGVWCLVCVPESVRWQLSRLQQAASWQGPIRELFRPPLRSRTIMGILLGTIPVIGTAANAQWIVPWSDQVQTQQLKVSAEDKSDPTAAAARPKPDPKSKARTMVSRSGGAVIGSLLGGILASFLGRRTTYFFISLLALGASTWIFGWLTPLHPWFLWASFGFGLIGVIYFGWLPLYLPELFPTAVRASGTGISFNSGRVLAAGVVLGTGVLVKLFGGDYARIGLWTGMIYGAGMLLILFAPRTDAGSLQD